MTDTVTSKAKFPPSGVYLAPSDTETLREKAKEAGISWFELNLAQVASKREFLAACAKSLRFPAHFGSNWDALADCLKDLCADCVVNCRNCAAFAEATPDAYATALEIFQDAASYWQECASTFVALADAEPEGERLPRLPGTRRTG